MLLIPKYTHGGFPTSQALHWNKETYQRLGKIIVSMMTGTPEVAKRAYCEYYELKRYFLADEFEEKINELDRFRKNLGAETVHNVLEIIKEQLIVNGDLEFNINQQPIIPDFEKSENGKELDLMKSRIIEISFSRVKNLGNYENCRVGAKAEIHPDEKPANVMKKLRTWVEKQTEE
jgi:hypothetical protein